MICHTEDELWAYAQTVASHIAEKDIVLFYGPLGVGKTFFIKALCSMWGIDASQVTSPTFNLVHQYRGTRDVAHFDLYRLSDREEFFLIGGEELLGQQTCLIEWPELIEDTLPSNYIRIDLTLLPDQSRQVQARRFPQGESL